MLASRRPHGVAWGAFPGRRALEEVVATWQVFPECLLEFTREFVLFGRLLIAISGYSSVPIILFLLAWVVQIENFILALAGVAQWIEHRPANQRVAGSSPSRGTCLRCEPEPQ